MASEYKKDKSTKYVFLSAMFISIVIISIAIFSYLQNNKQQETILTTEFITEIFGEDFAKMSNEEKQKDDRFSQYAMLVELEGLYNTNINIPEGTSTLLELKEGKGDIKHTLTGNDLKELRNEYIKSLVYISETPDEFTTNYLKYVNHMVYGIISEYLLLNGDIEYTDEDVLNYLRMLNGYEHHEGEEIPKDMLKMFEDSLILYIALEKGGYVNDDTMNDLIEFQGNKRDTYLIYTKGGTDVEGIDINKDIDKFVSDMERYEKDNKDYTVDELFNFLEKEGYDLNHFTYTDILPYDIYNKEDVLNFEPHLFDTTKEYKNGNEKVRVEDNPYMIYVAYKIGEMELSDTTMRILDAQNMYYFETESRNQDIDVIKLLSEQHEDITIDSKLQNILDKENLLYRDFLDKMNLDTGESYLGENEDENEEEEVIEEEK